MQEPCPNEARHLSSETSHTPYRCVWVCPPSTLEAGEPDWLTLSLHLPRAWKNPWPTPGAGSTVLPSLFSIFTAKTVIPNTYNDTDDPAASLYKDLLKVTTLTIDWHILSFSEWCQLVKGLSFALLLHSWLGPRFQTRLLILTLTISPSI